MCTKNIRSKEEEARKNAEALRHSDFVQRSRRYCEIQVFPEGETVIVRVTLRHENKLVDCRDFVADYHCQINIVQAIGIALDFYDLGRTDAEWVRRCKEVRKMGREGKYGL